MRAEAEWTERVERNGQSGLNGMKSTETNLNDTKPDKIKSEHLRKLRGQMEKVQDAKRFEHTLGVEFTAAALAMRYGAPVRSAQLAGLLHDCAKCLTDRERVAICRKNAIPMTELERANPFLLHAKVGAYLAKEKYDVKNQDILNAICNHTTGRPGMSLLEKIIFIADYMEPGRKHAPNLEEIRRLAFEDIDRALVKILSDTLEYLEGENGDIDPMTRRTWEYYQEVCREKSPNCGQTSRDDVL